MKVDLDGKRFRLVGALDGISKAVIAALTANGARRSAEEIDILIVSHALLPNPPARLEAWTTELTAEAEAMAAGGGGRIVLLLSAMAAIPMRRHIDYSAEMAAAAGRMRGLAMQFGPDILVNAVGAGMIGDESGHLLSGDENQLSHVALGKPGTVEDIVNAVLFLCDPLNSYTTGQLLTVDGGWSAGYGRNF
jgi:hypothetical protein